MPTNITTEYYLAEKEYRKASSTSDKIKALKKMLATVPKHKGTQKLRNTLKQRLARLRRAQEIEKRTGRRQALTIKKGGAAQIVFIGLPNSGKSTLLSKLSGSSVKVAEYPFTTKKPVVRMIPFENIKLQGIEIPALYTGFSTNPLARQLASLVRNSDFVILVVRHEEDAKVLQRELEKLNIKLGKEKKYSGFIQYLPYMVVTWDDFDQLEKLKAKIWQSQNKIRVQTKTRGKGIAFKPVILKTGATVKDIARVVHKDFLKRFRYAKIWGPSAKFKGQQVGLEHKLKDKDIVEIKLK